MPLEGINAQKIQNAPEENRTFIAGKKVRNNNFAQRSAISLPAHLLTELEQVITTIFQKVKGFFSKLFNCDDLNFSRTTEYNEKAEKANELSNATKTFQRKGERITSAAFKTYLETVDTSQAIIVENLLHSSGSALTAIDDAIEQAEKDRKRFISIPIVSAGHIVNLLIEFQGDNKVEIEFFDSFGHGSGHYFVENENVNNLISKVKHKLNDKGFTVTHFHENDAIVQQNKHDCGVYVAAYLEKRLATNVTLPQILQGFATTDSARLRKKQASTLRRKALEAGDAVQNDRSLQDVTAAKTPPVYPGMLDSVENFTFVR